MSTTITRLRAESETLRRHIEALRREKDEIDAEIAACEGRTAAAEWYRALATGADSDDLHRMYVRVQAEIALTATDLERHLSGLREEERAEVRAAAEEMMRAELLPDDAESASVVEPLGSTVDCGECGKRVPEDECCQECNHGCSMPGKDCPGRE